MVSLSYKQAQVIGFMQLLRIMGCRMSRYLVPKMTEVLKKNMFHSGQNNQWIKTWDKLWFLIHNRARRGPNRCFQVGLSRVNWASRTNIEIRLCVRSIHIKISFLELLRRRKSFMRNRRRPRKEWTNLLACLVKLGQPPCLLTFKS